MASLTAFQIFGLPRKFDLNLAELDKQYIEIQKKVHPDRFASASNAEKMVAQQWATAINDAYATLKDPVLRAKEICKLMGAPVNENSSGAIGEDFLIDQLERREAIEDAKAEGDEALLGQLKSQISEEKQQLLSNIARALDTENNPAGAAVDIQKVMFLNRQLEDLQ